MKKLLILGVVAVVGILLFAASPASAQDNEAITADPATVPATVGSVEVNINGTGWVGAPDGLFVTYCPGAKGDPDAITATNATSLCHNLLFSGSRGNPAADGTWSWRLDIPITQEDIDAGGMLVLAGELAPGTEWSASTVVQIGESAAEETTTTTEAPATTTTAASDSTEDDDMSDDDMSDDDMSDDDMADTGAESGLIAVIGISVLVAGLLALGLGRRLGKRA